MFDYSRQPASLFSPCSVTVGGLRLHGLPTGTVRVKNTHRRPSLGAPVILLDPTWTEPLPIYTWVIEHPEGLILVDTGETARVQEPGYFAGQGVNGWVNRRILRFDLSPADEIGPQLRAVGLAPEQVRWVVLTHLHLDHVDGLRYFPQAEVLVSEAELRRPYGHVPGLLPPWFKPRPVRHALREFAEFDGAYPLTQAGDVWLLPTPGHSHGHQSVLLRTDNIIVVLAGDMTFDEGQLRRGEVAGICVDKAAAAASLQAMQRFCRRTPTVYLPSHDPGAAERLSRLRPTELS